MLKFLTSLKYSLLAFCPGYRQIKSVECWHDTGRAIYNWIDANTIPISWSETGRALVREHIKAYLEFLRCHRFIEEDIEYIEMWCRHLTLSPHII